MGELLPTYDMIVRILLIGLVFASCVFVGYFMCSWWSNHQCKRQDREAMFLMVMISILMQKLFGELND